MTTRISANSVNWWLPISVFAALLGPAIVPLRAQIVTSTWTGGSGNWSNCPNQGGNALWDTCGANPPYFPNGATNSAVINGGPVYATSAEVYNLTLTSGSSLVFPATVPSIVDIAGTSIQNDGSITLAGFDGMGIIGPTTVTLSGSGSVTMAGNRLTGSGNPTLIVEQPIQGQGTFSDGIAIVNHSTINAVGGTLYMQPTNVVNTGTMEASSGGIMELTTGFSMTYTNTGGTIQALNGGVVQMDGSTFTGGTITTAGTGVIQANGDAVLNSLTNNGAVLVSAAALEGAITNTGVIQVPSATLSMNGPVTLTGSGSILMSGTSNLRTFGGPTDALTNQQLIHGAGTIYELPITNQGQIVADTKGNTLALSGSTTNNTSLLEANGGTLELNSVINNSGGTIEALTGSTVIFTTNFNGSINGGTLTTAGNGVIEANNGELDGTVNIPTNAGKLNVVNGLAVQGTINNTGTITILGNACITLNLPTTLTGSGKLVMNPNTCFEGLGNSFTNQSTIEGSGSIGDSNPMPITNTGTILASQSSPLLIVPDASGFTNTGKLMVHPGSAMTIKNTFNNLSPAGVLTGGTYVVSGMLTLQNSITTNEANITLQGAAAEIFNNSPSNNALGALAANAGKGVLLLESGQALATTANLANAGKITVATGSSLSVGGTYTQTAGTTQVDGALSVNTSMNIEKGTLLGQGAVAAGVISGGTVTVGDAATKPGKLSISGTYTQAATGVLNLAISGTTVGTQYSQLAVSNGVSLGGTLNLKVVNGFTPAIGDTFTIVTGSAVSGTFSTVKGLSINSAEHFAVSYGANSVTLIVVSGAN
jgi:hypothetical protein